MKGIGLAAFGTLASLVAACSLVGRPGESANSPARQQLSEHAVRHLVQLDFGPRSHFAECLDPGCPARTPKVAVSSAPSSAVSAGFGPSKLPPPGLEVPKGSKTDAPEPIQVRLSLLFPIGGATLSEDHKAQLRRALHSIQESDKVVVAGRTDDLGSETLNQALALARGLAVRDYLLNLDPQLPARLAIDSRGRCCYVAPNVTEASRSRNRRVEISYSLAEPAS